MHSSGYKLAAGLATALLLPMLAIPAANAAPDAGGIPASTSVVDSFMAAQHALLDDPADKYLPATRWWLAEGLHTDQTIKDNMETLHNMGIGRVEIVCMPEPNVDSDYPDAVFVDNSTGKTPQQTYSWGSDEWKNDTKLIIEEANKYGMGFSMTSGTHWANANLPFANLKYDDDGAGKALAFATQSVDAGATFSDTLRRSNPMIAANSVVNNFALANIARQDLVSVVAVHRADNSATFRTDTYGNDTFSGVSGDLVYTGDPIVLNDLVRLNGQPVGSFPVTDATGQADFTVDWTAPAGSGTWDIYSFWMQATGQSPVPSSSVNVTINYIDAAGMQAFIDYYRNFIFNDPELKAAIIANGLGEMYMDSLEISTSNANGGQFWGSTLMSTFRANRGYDLTPYLPFIVKTGNGRSAVFHTDGDDSVFITKVRNDLFETMTEMYTNNILKPLRAYLHDEMNMKLRAEITYGVNYEITTPAQGVDYVETESLEFGNQLDAHRQLAGAAHANGLRYSSETGAISGNNLTWTQDRFMQIMNTQFASGISYTVFHGFSAIPGADSSALSTADQWNNGTYWPGHEGMYARFSERWGPRQPESTQYTDYMPMIARTQAVLQQGIPQMDLAIMRTDYSFNNGAPSTDYTRQRKAEYFKDLKLQDNGYTYDYFAPEILEGDSVSYTPDGGLIPENVGYQALILYQDSIRMESAQKILSLAQAGLPVVVVNGLTESLNYTTNYYNDKAAIHTLGNSDGTDLELATIMGQLEQLPNVKVVDAAVPDNASNPNPRDADYEQTYYYGKTGVYEALQQLGVQPRTMFTEPTSTFLTFTRKTDNTMYVWVYNYMDPRGDYFNNPIDTATATTTISVDALGKPYDINTWTSDIQPLATYQAANGRTSFDVTLEPGQTTVIALDLTNPGVAPVQSTNATKAVVGPDGPAIIAAESGAYSATLADGTVVNKQITVPNDVNLTNWNLVIDSWTPGDKQTITEARTGYTTKEVYFETKHTDINVGPTELIPWKDMSFTAQDPATVSGVGTYTTSFTLPSTWGATDGAYLNVDSTGGGLSQVWVNDQKITGYDFIAGQVDVSSALKPGDNTIKIEVASALRNEMRALGYPNLPAANTVAGEVASNGLQGNVTLQTYSVAAIGAPVPPPTNPNPPAGGNGGASIQTGGSAQTPSSVGVAVALLVAIGAGLGTALVFRRRV